MHIFNTIGFVIYGAHSLCFSTLESAAHLHERNSQLLSLMHNEHRGTAFPYIMVFLRFWG